MTGIGISQSLKWIQPPILPDLSALVTDEGTPRFTYATHGLQAQNLWTLIGYFLASGLEAPQGYILDVGGGDGLLFGLHPWIQDIPTLAGRGIILADKAESQIRRSRKVVSLLPSESDLERIVLDPIKLEELRPDSRLTTTDRKRVSAGKPVVLDYKLPHIGIVISNSMLHWIKGDQLKFQSLTNIYDLLPPNGVALISMSALGTAQYFLEAYFSVMGKLGTYHKHNNKFGHHGGVSLEDPIGSVQLYRMVELAKSAGFIVLKQDLSGDEVSYPQPELYANAVKVYGFDNFMAHVWHYGRKREDSLWDEIVREFLTILRTRKVLGRDGSFPYTQYNIYLVLQKPQVQPQSDIVKRKDLELEISSFLNTEFLKRTYNFLTKRDPPITIKLTGESRDIEGFRTDTNVPGMLSYLFGYATKNWDESDPNPEINVAYEVKGDYLTIGVRTRIVGQLKTKEIFGKKFLDQIEATGAEISSRTVDNSHTYTIKVPIFSNVEQLLNEGNLTRIYRRVLGLADSEPGTRTYHITCEGIRNDLINLRSHVNLRSIFDGVVGYAVKDWIDGDTSPVIEVRFYINEDKLTMQFDLKTKTKKRPEDVLDAKVQDNLRSFGLNISSTSITDGIRYSFDNIPTYSSKS